MDEQKARESFRQRHTLAVRGGVLAVVLSAPVILNNAARAGNHPLMWGMMGIMVLAMVVAIWAG